MSGPNLRTAESHRLPVSQISHGRMTPGSIAGTKIPADMQGKSLVPLLKGEKPSDWRKSLYYHYYEYPSVHMVPRHYGVRGEKYKLMHFYQFDEWEFYDLANDPDELVNEYENPAYAKQIAEARTELERLRKYYDDDSDVSVKPKQWQDGLRNSQALSN